MFQITWLIQNNQGALFHSGKLFFDEFVCDISSQEAHWIFLRLPSCGQGSNPKNTNYNFIVKMCTLFVIVLRKGQKGRKKGPRLAHNKKLPCAHSHLSVSALQWACITDMQSPVDEQPPRYNHRIILDESFQTNLYLNKQKLQIIGSP